MEAAGASSCASTLFLDDSTRNIAAASEMGIFTVLVGRLGTNVGAHMEVPPLKALGPNLNSNLNMLIPKTHNCTWRCCPPRCHRSRGKAGPRRNMLLHFIHAGC